MSNRLIKLLVYKSVSPSTCGFLAGFPQVADNTIPDPSIAVYEYTQGPSRTIPSTSNRVYMCASVYVYWCIFVCSVYVYIPTSGSPSVVHTQSAEHKCRTTDHPQFRARDNGTVCARTQASLECVVLCTESTQASLEQLRARNAAILDVVVPQISRQ